jgi:ABC-type bacteriocin/lantibiotic exporter with double-glycine peptidase domain
MIKTKEIRNIFTNGEIFSIGLILIGILIVNILDVFSFVIIVPIFKIIFLNEDFKLGFFQIQSNLLSTKIKILILSSFAIIFFFKNIFAIFFNFFYINFFKKVNSRISNQIFNSFLSQEYIFFIKNSADSLIQKVTRDVDGFNFFMINTINVLCEILFVIGISCLLFYNNYKVFLLLFFIFIVSLTFYSKFFKSKIRKWSNVNRDSSITTQNLAIEGLKGFKDIILYNLKQNFILNFNNNILLYHNANSKINFLNSIIRYWLELLLVTAMTLALIFFVFTNYSIQALIPIFGLFVLASLRLLSSMNKIIMFTNSMKFLYPSYNAVLQESNSFNLKDKLELNSQFVFNESIEIMNVNFSYSNNSKNILENVNLKIYKNKSIIVLGDNGSGKSTLLNLISGLIEPTKGKIIIDKNYDLYSNRKNWFNDISYVQQNIFLLDATIKQNIVLCDESKINFNKLNKILDALKIQRNFKNLKDYLNTRVGPDGLILSGGQKQIISLARALYKDSNILILDEPTFALDVENVELVKKIIIDLKNKKTIIMVTHDSSFLSYFDLIYKIDLGKIISV